MTTATTICLPGILARAEEQFRPLNPVFEESGANLSFFDFDPARFNAEAEVRGIAGLVRSRHHGGAPVTLLCASLSGMLAPFVVRQLAADKPQDWLKVIIVDAPTGADTMCAVPTWGTGIFNRDLKPSFENGRVAKLVMKQFSKGLPKDEFITTPDAVTRHQLAGHEVAESDWAQWVKDEAASALTGHRFLAWYEQIGWMIDVGKSGQLAGACAFLHGLDVTYLACTAGNDVVEQMTAAKLWQTYVPTMTVDTVDASHCGFLQNQPECAQALRQLLIV